MQRPWRSTFGIGHFEAEAKREDGGIRFGAEADVVTLGTRIKF